MGFQKWAIEQALLKCDFVDDENKMFDYLSQLNNYSSMEIEKNGPFYEQAPTYQQQLRNDENDADLNAAIMESMKQTQSQNFVWQVNPTERQRNIDKPIGIQNVGNTCYFNSLIHIYFGNHKLTKQIMEFKEENTENKNNERLQASIQLVKNLKNLFAQMTMSSQSFVNPQKVIESIVDDFGKPLPIGEQKDVGEFNQYFLARIQEGLLSQQNQNQMEIQDDSQNIIQQMYFGQNKVKFINQQNNQEIVSTNEEFQMIMLDVEQQELYESWDDSNNQIIEEFKTETGVLKAIKQESLKTVPGYLFFQINRIQFNRQTSELSKKNIPFQFHKDIFVDRFLDNNSDEYQQIRTKVQVLKYESQKLKNAINKLVNYGEKQNCILDVLQDTKRFIECQSDVISQDILNDPLLIGGISQQNKNNIISQIELFRMELKHRLNSLQQQLDQLNTIIADSYTHMNKTKFQISSILIHDGNPQKGHYYSFTYDFSLNKWFRLNDSITKEETEEIVFQEALGGHQNMSAYCLIYTNQELVQSQQYPFRSLLSWNNQANDPYFAIIQDYIQLKQNQQNSFQSLKNANFVNNLLKVQNENELFQKELDEFLLRKNVSELLDSYNQKLKESNKRYNQIQEKIKNQQVQKFNPPNICSFDIFVRVDKPVLDIKSNDEIYKYFLLDSAIRQKYQNEQILQYLNVKHPNLFNELQAQMKKNSNQIDMKLNLIYTYKEKLQNFQDLIQSSTICQYFFEQALSQNFIEALLAVDLNNQLVCQIQYLKQYKFFSYFRINFEIFNYIYQCQKCQIQGCLQKLTNHISRVLLIAFGSYILQKLNEQSIQLDDLNKYCEFIVNYASKNIDRQNIIFAQLQIYIQEIVSQSQIHFQDQIQNNYLQLLLNPQLNQVISQQLNDEFKQNLNSFNDQNIVFQTDADINESIRVNLINLFEKFRTTFKNHSDFFTFLNSSEAIYMAQEQRKQKFNIF